MFLSLIKLHTNKCVLTMYSACSFRLLSEGMSKILLPVQFSAVSKCHEHPAVLSHGLNAQDCFSFWCRMIPAYGSHLGSSLNIRLCNEPKPFLQKIELRPVSVLCIWEIYMPIPRSALSSEPNVCNDNSNYYLTICIPIGVMNMCIHYVCQSVVSLNNPME